MIEKFEKFLKDNFEKANFKIEAIKENDAYRFCYLKSDEPYDVPVLVEDKKTGKIKVEVLPPFTDDEDAKTIWEAKDDFDEDSEEDFE